MSRPFDQVCKACTANLKQEIEKGKTSQAEALPSSEDMILSSQSQPSQQSNYSETSDGQQCVFEEKIDCINKSLGAFEISPIKVTQAKSRISQKFNLLADRGKKLFNITEQEGKPVESDDQIIINNLKAKLSNMSYEEKISALTIVPQNWTYSRFQEEFGVTKHFVTIVKSMQQQKIDKRERKKRCDSIDPEIKKRCEEFYRKSYISRELPGEYNLLCFFKTL